MGIIFKHLEDLAVIKDLFSKDTKVEYGELDVYDEGEQAGKSINVEDCYEIVPVHRKQMVPTIAEEYERDVILWDVWAYDYNPGVHYYSDGSGEPPSVDEREMGSSLSLYEAIKLITLDIFRCQYDSTMEQMSYEDNEIDEALQPEW